MSNPTTVNVEDIIETVRSHSAFNYADDRLSFLEDLGIEVGPRTLRVLIDVEIRDEIALVESPEEAASELDFYGVGDNVDVVSAAWRD